MAKIHTHYDNLKVSRNAPPEIIRAAYKTLSQRFHPDKNLGNTEAVRIMVIINTSYDVLSKPNRRREHDQWIAQQELNAAQVEYITRQSRFTSKTPPVHSSSISRINTRGILAHIFRYSIPYGLIGLFLWNWITEKPSTPLERKHYNAELPPFQLNYVRPSTAPNGQPWPVFASYVKGDKPLHSDILSTITVENSQNDSDVFVKLVSLGCVEAYPLRQFYIPAFGSFTMSKITAGSYDICYRNLSNVDLSRSDSFNIEEIRTFRNTQYSNFTTMLHKDQQGNMQAYDLSEAEF